MSKDYKKKLEKISWWAWKGKFIKKESKKIFNESEMIDLTT
jgi:hypothetical protein